MREGMYFIVMIVTIVTIIIVTINNLFKEDAQRQASAARTELYLKEVAVLCVRCMLMLGDASPREHLY